MMALWTGKLFVFRDEHGWDHVSLTFPANSGTATVRAFSVSGPFIPIGLKTSIVLEDAGQWFAELVQKGFTYQPCTIDA